MKRLTNKIAAITGGTSGIGLATAKKFVDEGAYVFIMGRRKDALEQALAILGKDNAFGFTGDTGNLVDVKNFFNLIAKEKGRLDVLFANAGVVSLSSVVDMEETEFDRMININIKGVYFTVQSALPLFKASGSIVMTGSIAGNKGLALHSAYSATKAAVRSLARTFTSELAPAGIRVNTIMPGAIDTPIIDGQFNKPEEAMKAKDTFASLTPLGRIGQAKEVAEAVLWLASEESSYVTGAEIAIDGGFAQV